MSKAPQSKAPESKTTQSKAPESSYAQSRVPVTRVMPTNADGVESKAAQSKAPQSKAPESKVPRSEAPKSSYTQSRASETRIMPSRADLVESKAPESKYPQSRPAGTRAMPSRADLAESKAPESKYPQSRPAGTRTMPSRADLAESKAPESKYPQSRPAGTRAMPSRADLVESKTPQSKVPESKAPRSEAPKSSYAQSRSPGTRVMPSRADLQAAYSRGPGTKPSYDDDDEYDEPEPKPQDSKQPKSFLFTPKDHSMAERQSRYGTLTPQQQQENDAWANEMFKAGNTCPEGKDWIRSKGRASWFGHGAYYCLGLGHVATDPLVSEAMGAMYATIGEEGEGKLDRIVGPFYPHPDQAEGTCYAEDMVLKGYTVRMEDWIKPPANKAEKEWMIRKMTR